MTEKALISIKVNLVSAPDAGNIGDAWSFYNVFLSLRKNNDNI